MALMRVIILILVALPLTLAPLGCGVPQNNLSLYQRSMVIQDPDAEREILSRAVLEETGDERLNNIKTLYLQGTPYEMGFQHGALLREDIQAMYGKVIGMAKLFATEQMMDEVYDLMEPYIPLEEKEEMRGLAHGAEVPLRLVHWVHSIPEVSEFGPKKQFRRGFKQTSCSNLVAFGNATVDGDIYQLRVLDWIRNLGVQQWPVILVHQPDRGHGSVTFSYAGFIGSISGMNDQKMAFGEMGYGDPEGESLEGMPFIFLFRKLMREANNLAAAEKIIREVRRTNSYVYVISDAKAKNGEPNSLLFITDRSRVLTFGENTHLIDEREIKKKKKVENYPAIDDVVYGGAKGPVLHDAILENYGRISVATLMEITKPVSLKSNMQNVIFKPASLQAWVSNAASEKGEEGKACNQQWFHFDFAEALAKRALPQQPALTGATAAGGRPPVE